MPFRTANIKPFWFQFESSLKQTVTAGPCTTSMSFPPRYSWHVVRLSNQHDNQSFNPQVPTSCQTIPTKTHSRHTCPSPVISYIRLIQDRCARYLRECMKDLMNAHQPTLKSLLNEAYEFAKVNHLVARRLIIWTRC